MDNGVLRTLVQRDAGHEISCALSSRRASRWTSSDWCSSCTCRHSASRASPATPSRSGIKTSRTRRRGPARFHVSVNEILIATCWAAGWKNPSTDLLAETTGPDPTPTVVRRRWLVPGRPASTGSVAFRGARRPRPRRNAPGCWNQLAYRELPRIPDGHLGTSLVRAGTHAGREIRCGGCRRTQQRSDCSAVAGRAGRTSTAKRSAWRS